MSEYKKLIVSPPEAISELSKLFETLKAGIDTIYNTAKVQIELAKLTASPANLALLALSASLDEIIIEIEKLKGGTFSGIMAHPNAHGITADYDRNTDTMTLSAVSALEQVQDALDDEGDDLAPDKFNDYSSLIIVGAVPGLEEFFDILESVGKFFNERELLDLKEQLKERWEEEEVVVKLPKGINFFGKSIAQTFPAYASILNKAQSFVEDVKSGIISVSGNYDDLIEFADKKLAEAEKIATEMKDFLDQFKFEISEAGVYYKTFSSQKVDDIKEELIKGMPDSWSNSKYSLVFGVFDRFGAMEIVFDILSLD